MFKSFFKALAGMCIAGQTVQAAGGEDWVDGVMMLNEFSFFDTVKANDYLLVYFYKDRWYVISLV